MIQIIMKINVHKVAMTPVVDKMEKVSPIAALIAAKNLPHTLFF